MPASPIRKLVPFADEAKRRGTHVYHLNIGQPDIESPDLALSSLQRLERKVIAYSHSQGEPGYIDALLGYYNKLGFALERPHINVTTGGSEAILFSLLVTMNPGEEVLIPEPFYTNYNAFARVAGVTIRPITTRVEDGFHLPPSADMESLIGPKTRAVMLCNPSNPTGTVYTREEMDRVIALAEKHNLWLLCDEVYREFVFDSSASSYRSLLERTDIAERVVVMDSISKRYSMCGARLGCVVSRNEEVMAAVLKLAQARLSSPQVEQWMAQAAHAMPDDYLPSVLEEYRQRRDVVYTALQSMEGVTCRQPEGAFYTIPELPIDNAETFAKWLLTDFSYEGATVMVAPAAGFYATPGLGMQQIRIAFVLEVNALKKAMTLLQRALQTYQDTQMS